MEQEQEQEQQQQQQHSGYSTKGDNYGGELWAEVISTEPRASILHNLLSKDECHHLINLAKPHLERSTMIDFVTNVRQVDPSRTSTQATLARGQDKIVSDIEKRVADFTSIPVEHGEGLRILHYEVGGKFEPHYDYFDDRVYENGGPRMITIIMYLSDVEEGGETYFPFAKGGKVSVKPKMGDALIFWSMKPDGTSDLISIHGGSPVVKGEKWLCTKSLHVNEYMC